MFGAFMKGKRSLGGFEVQCDKTFGTSFDQFVDPQEIRSERHLRIAYGKYKWRLNQEKKQEKPRRTGVLVLAAIILVILLAIGLASADDYFNVSSASFEPIDDCQCSVKAVLKFQKDGRLRLEYPENELKPEILPKETVKPIWKKRLTLDKKTATVRKESYLIRENNKTEFCTNFFIVTQETGAQYLLINCWPESGQK